MTGQPAAGGPSAGAGAGRRFCIVASRFNQAITDRLVEGARSCFEANGTDPDDIEVLRVPGAFELPLAVRWVLDRGGVDGVAALGCVIRGETPHFEYISAEAARGLGAVARDSPVPIAFGVLTTDTDAQAVERADPARQDKGRQAALAALEMIDVVRRLGKGGP
jgi:6,7-dimethyl-8-ribityllumazine synthase